jgi:hypothetical protein
MPEGDSETPLSASRWQDAATPKQWSWFAGRVVRFWQATARGLPSPRLREGHAWFGSPTLGDTKHSGLLCMRLSPYWLAGCLHAIMLVRGVTCLAQIDPYPRNLLQFGYDQPLEGSGPQGVYAYYYYNNPDFLRTNVALRLAVAPVYLDGELGFKELISPTTHFGIGVYGGAFGANFYEVRQGTYYKDQSFNGSGGGSSLNLYQLLNPGRRVPLNLVLRAGFRYSAFSDRPKTVDNFVLPEDGFTTFVRAGLRLAGKEPLLYPDLSMELSVWVEQQWRTGTGSYGLSNDRTVEPTATLYWAYAGLNYAWTNSGHKVSFAVTAGGVEQADAFSAWRPGGVLPLAAEFPLILPGYYYQELTVTRFVHLSALYFIPLGRGPSWQLVLGAASARLDYLPGYEQPTHWQTGVGVGLTFTPKSQIYRCILRYGYGFNAIRNGHEGGQSIGVLFQFDFEQRKKVRRSRL